MTVHGKILEPKHGKGTVRIGQEGLLNADDHALERIVKAGVAAAMLGYRHAPQMHYTQGPERWQGIATEKRAVHGEYPTEADCSAFATWVLWTATYSWRPPDFVNDTGWASGHTGTLVHQGREVEIGHGQKLRPLDLVFYGDESWRPEHVAVVVVGGTIQTAKVVSFGSEPGPFLLPCRYRTDTAVGGWLPRRYIH